MKQYDNRFVVAVLICLKEIIFHISSYLNFCVCKYTNFLFSTVGRNIAANGSPSKNLSIFNLTSVFTPLN